MGLALIVTVTIIILDQVSKYIILQNLAVGERIPVIGEFFSIFHIRNSGAAWGFLSEHSWGISLLTVISIVASIYIFYLILQNQFKMFRLIMSFILAGSIGNLIDRIRFNNVVDFLSFKFGSYYFPTFNIADSSIVIGGFLLMIYLLKNKEILDELVLFKKTQPAVSNTEKKE